MTEPLPALPASRWASRIVLAAFAFLLASTPAVATSMWWHLAEGRRLIETADILNPVHYGPYHPTPIYDLWTYLSYQISPHYGIVVGHALLAALGVFLSFGLGKSRWGWLSLAVAGVAVLAIGVRLPATSETAALALVGFLSWCLKADTFDRFKWKPILLLVITLAIWAHFDGSFFFGLFMVACTLFGRACDSPSGTRRKALRTSLVVVFLGAAACLTNPLHPIIFPLPEFLLPGQSISPFSEGYRMGIGSSPAGLAFYAVLILGVASFLLNRSTRRWEDLLPWAVFGALASWKSPAVTFFVLISGPALASQFGHVNPNDLLNRSGRFRRYVCGFLATVMIAALFVMAWPGWLQPKPFTARGWIFAPPEAYEQTAKQVSQWYEEGLIPPDSSIEHLSQESSDAFAWFAPKLPRQYNSYFSQYVKPTNDIQKAIWFDELTHARRRLIVGVATAQNEDAAAHVKNLLFSPKEALPLLLNGQVWVFGWTRVDPGVPGLDFGKLYDAKLDYNPKLLKAGPLPAPVEEIPANPWLRSFRIAVPVLTTDLDEAKNLHRYAEALRYLSQHRPEAIWKSLHIAAMTGSAASWSSPFSFIDAWRNLTLSSNRKVNPQDPDYEFYRYALKCYQANSNSLNLVPPQIYLAAIRSARRAIQANPDDAQAYLLLGESYYLLSTTSSERETVQKVPELRILRHIQVVSALTRAIELDPKLAQAHILLNRVYDQFGYHDLSLQHLERYCELTGQTDLESVLGPVLAEYRVRVSKNEKTYLEKSGNLTQLQQAELAESLGLILRARDLLPDFSLSTIRPASTRHRIEWALRTGHAFEIPAKEDEWKAISQQLTSDVSRWIRIQTLVARGQLTEAAQLADEIPESNTQKSPEMNRRIATMAGRLVLDGARPQSSLPNMIHLTLSLMDTENLYVERREQFEMDLSSYLISGVLRMESGDKTGARERMNRVLKLTGENKLTPKRSFGRIAEQYLSWLE